MLIDVKQYRQCCQAISNRNFQTFRKTFCQRLYKRSSKGSKKKKNKKEKGEKKRKGTRATGHERTSSTITRETIYSVASRRFAEFVTETDLLQRCALFLVSIVPMVTMILLLEQSEKNSLYRGKADGTQRMPNLLDRESRFSLFDLQSRVIICSLFLRERELSSLPSLISKLFLRSKRDGSRLG